MSTPGKMRSDAGSIRLVPGWSGLILGIILLALGGGNQVAAEVTVTTLGGGRLIPEGADFGFTDGDILQASQFNNPAGCAVDLVGRVYVADRGNGALRQLDLAANRCRTVVQGLSRPVAVAIDTSSIVYVLTEGDGSIHKLDRGVASLLVSGLNAPTAMAFDGDHSMFVTQANGTVVRVNLRTQLVSGPVATGLHQPSGIAVLDSGLLAVSEPGLNAIRIIDPRDGVVQRQIGSGQLGFANGPAASARFNQPYHIAKGPGGTLLVADRGNSRVRLVDADAFVTTLYGVDPVTWEGPSCTECNPIILPGWLDGTVEFAEARDPWGVAVGSDGRIYTTETYYHLVREVSGTVFTPGGGDGGPEISVLPPVITPRSGYYPMGQHVTVLNPNASSFLPSAVYYTTDGSEPTTNSLRVALDNGLGTILWQEKMRDLTSLQLRAFYGGNSSDIVSGQPVSTTEIGVPQDVIAGVGSTVILPVVVNLRTNDQLRSLQFRVEITPELESTPMIAETYQPLAVSTNDFIPLVTSAEAKGEAQFSAGKYEFNRTRGVAITFLGTNANFFVKNFAVVAMLAVPIPNDAPLGSRYLVEILNPSGTSDAAQGRVSMLAMPARTITVTRSTYLVGDTSPGIWYNARSADPRATAIGFGDGTLDNSDVNSAFTAALGRPIPYPGTDLYDALDAFPEDTISSAGGDGLIRFLDWQVILLRSLGLETARWERTWSEGGVRQPSGSPNAAPNTPGQTLSAPPEGAVWTRQAALSAGSVEYVVPGSMFDVPIYVEILSGCELAGLAFRATVEPRGAAPVLTRAVQFVPAPNLPAPTQSQGIGSDTVLCGWPIVPSSAFDPPLRGKQVLGYLRLAVPITAQRGDVYRVRFANADGSPDLQTQYDFETRPASLWVLNPALSAAEPSSDEWKIHFFGSTASEAARPESDPDGDGLANSAEYLAGTNPTDPNSYLRLGPATMDSGKRVVLRWLSAPGKSYQVESASSLSSPTWAVLATGLLGDGRIQQWTHSPPVPTTSFYRIRLQP